MKPSERIDSEVKSARAAIESLALLCNKLADAVTDGKIMAMPEVPSPASVCWTDTYRFRAPSVALAALEAMKAKADPVRAACDEAASNNSRLAEALKTRLIACGLATQERETSRVRGKVKTEWVAAGWVQSLSRQVPTCSPMQGFDTAYERAKKDIAGWEQKEAQKSAEAERARELAKAADKHAQAVGVLAAKYGLTLPADDDDVLQAILAKNKYLRLAHYMQANRGDWTEGYDLARTGLDGFVVETDTDRAIAADVRSNCEREDVDGRYFRDSEWSYDRLFGMVAEELMADYLAITGNS